MQRTYACSQHTIAGAECSACCPNEPSTLHRSQWAFGPLSTPVAVPGNAPAEVNGTSFDSAFNGVTRFGHDFSQIPVHSPVAGVIQTKLAINKPGDEYEQEAERISEQVMRMPEPQLQRACACGGACPKCQTEQPDREHERLQTNRVQVSDTGQTPVPPIVHEVLRSPGQPLDSATRAFMEPHFGYDFSRVRVHTDAAAEQSAQDVNAHAYTVGHHMVFGAGRFAPEIQEGRRLLAHELTHVVQQRQQLGPPMIHRQLAHGSGAGAAPSAYPVGLKVPIHPDAITGIHDWTDAYGAKGRADTYNTFDVGTFVMQQICIIDDTGAQRVYVYRTQDRTDKDETYAVGPDSVGLFVAQHGGNITAHARNTDQLPSREPQLDPRKLPAAPDAFREEPTLYYTAPTLPQYDVSADAFGIGKYSMKAYLRRMPDGSLAVLYYVAENTLSLFRNEYVVGPRWLGVFTDKVGNFMLLAEIAYPLEPGAMPSGYQAYSARYLAGIMHGDPERASEGVKAWKAAFKDPSWWFQVVMGYLSAGVPEPPVGTPNLKVLPGDIGESRIPVPGATAQPNPMPVGPSRVTVSSGGAAGAAAAAEPLPITHPDPLPVTTPRPGPRPVPGWNPNPAPVAPRVSPPSPISAGATIGVLSKVGGVHATSPVPLPAPAPDPKKQRDQKKKKIYPICWPTILPPPFGLNWRFGVFFNRTRSPDRDYSGDNQKALKRRWERERKGDIVKGGWHIHHVIPLFLGGPDDLNGNGILWPAETHLKGHRWLRDQPQLKNEKVGEDLYDHPIGTMYYLAGFKESQGEKCGEVIELP